MAERDIHNLTLSMANSMAVLTQRSCILDATIAIPTFDGENPPLRTFAQHVENGLALLPDDSERTYLKVILTKLTGPARTSVQDKTFTDVASLIKHLKKRFSPGKNLAYFQAEIARLKIRENESLRKYIDRTSRLVHQTRAAIKEKYNRHTEEIIKDMETDVLENFREGLPESISWRVASLEPKAKTLEDIFEAVLIIEQRLKNRRDSSFNSPARSSRRDYRDESRKYVSYPHSPTPRDKHRHRYQDTSDTSPESEHHYRRKPSAFTLRRRDASRSPSCTSDSSVPDVDRKHHKPNKPLKTRLYCWNCGVKGHDGDDCKRNSRREYNRNYKNSSSRDTSVESTGSLNFKLARRTDEPSSEKKSDRQKTVRFEDKERRNTSLKKHQPREFEQRSQNWKREKENS